MTAKVPRFRNYGQLQAASSRGKNNNASALPIQLTLALNFYLQDHILVLSI